MLYQGTAHSLKLSCELKTLSPPFIALGFDQHMIADSRVVESIIIGELQSLEHCCKYGRPL
jgi:hypothetical protein